MSQCLRQGFAHADAIDIIFVDHVAGAAGKKVGATRVRHLSTDNDDGSGKAGATQYRHGLRGIGGRLQRVVEKYVREVLPDRRDSRPQNRQ